MFVIKTRRLISPEACSGLLLVELGKFNVKKSMPESEQAAACAGPYQKLVADSFLD